MIDAGGAARRRHAAAAYLLRRPLLEEALLAFHRHGLRTVLLKGAALVETVYGHPGDRPMTDVDLWCPDGPEALSDVLPALGYTPCAETPGTFQKGPLRLDASDSLWFLSPAESEKVWSRTRAIRVGEAEARVLDPADAFIHTVVHGLVHHGDWEPRWTRDLELLAPTIEDPAALGERANAWGVLESLVSLTSFTDNALNNRINVLLYIWKPRPSFWKIAVLRRCIASRQPGRGHLLRLIFQPARRRPAFLWRMMFPHRAFLTHRYPGPAQRSRWARPWRLAASGLRVLTGLVRSRNSSASPSDFR